MTIRDRLRNSYKLKAAGGSAHSVLSPALSVIRPLWRRMTLGHRLRAMPALYIHLGCGHINDPRFLNVDARPLGHVHYVTGSPLMPALPPARADMIYACHVFEHVSYRKQMEVLKRWHALLKPGGELRLSVPDFEKLVGMYQRKEASFPKIESALMGGQNYPQNFHQALFTAEHLAALLAKAGFINIGTWQAKDQDNWPKDWSWAEHLSLNLRALRP